MSDDENVSTPRKVQRSSTLVISNWKIHEVIIEKSVPNPFLFVNLIHFQLSFQGLLTLNSDRAPHNGEDRRTAAFMTFHQHRIVARGDYELLASWTSPCSAECKTTPPNLSNSHKILLGILLTQFSLLNLSSPSLPHGGVVQSDRNLGRWKVLKKRGMKFKQFRLDVIFPLEIFIYSSEKGFFVDGFFFAAPRTSEENMRFFLQTFHPSSAQCRREESVRWSKLMFNQFFILLSRQQLKSESRATGDLFV